MVVARGRGYISLRQSIWFKRDNAFFSSSLLCVVIILKAIRERNVLGEFKKELSCQENIFLEDESYVKLYSC